MGRLSDARRRTLLVDGPPDADPSHFVMHCCLTDWSMAPTA